MKHLKFTNTDIEIQRCFPVMQQLVPTLEQDQFLKHVRNKENYGYTLLALENDNEIIGVSGVRFYAYFAIGKFLIIDDFVIDKKQHRNGWGTKMFHDIAAFAKENNCSEIHLESSTDLTQAHRFYKTLNMIHSHHHFTLKLT